jgi:RNA polymerase sigma factor (TIGR02999 family)
MISMANVVRLLESAEEGDENALRSLAPLVYDELRRLAHAYLRREREGHTLQTTALVHEAYVRLAGQDAPSWRNRTHFRAIAAETMRRILVEYARARNRAKRGGGGRPVTLEDTIGVEGKRPVDVEALDQALNRLVENDPRMVRIVELRFFGGLTVQETAEALGISPATVKREWATARAWLRRELRRSD